MAKVTLDKVLEDVKALTPDEQRKLREQLDTLLKNPLSLIEIAIEIEPTSRPREKELERNLLEAGLLSEIKPMAVDEASYRSYKPVEVKGKPVSETLIEERR